MSNYTLNPETLLQRNESRFLASRMGQEIVMMNMENGDYLGINMVGSDIWDKLAQPMQVKELLSNLIAEYDVDPAVCEQETTQYLHQMLDNEMIIVIS